MSDSTTTSYKITSATLIIPTIAAYICIIITAYLALLPPYLTFFCIIFTVIATPIGIFLVRLSSVFSFLNQTNLQARYRNQDGYFLAETSADHWRGYNHWNQEQENQNNGW